MRATCHFPAAWTLLQAIPLADLTQDVVSSRPALAYVKAAACLAICLLDDMAVLVSGDDREKAGWYREDANYIAKGALDAMTDDLDAQFDQMETHA